MRGYYIWLLTGNFFNKVVKDNRILGKTLSPKVLVLLLHFLEKDHVNQFGALEKNFEDTSYFIFEEGNP